MTINIAAGAAAYANAAKKLTMPGSGDDSVSTGGTTGDGQSFGDLLKTSLESAVGTEKQAETTGIRAAAGKADINDVVTAVSNAEVTLQTVAAVRDKVVSAYQEIMRLAI